MHLGRLTVAFLLLLAAIDIALLFRSLNTGPEQRAPAIGQASIQRIDDSSTGSLAREPLPERMPGAAGGSNNRPAAESEHGPSLPKSED